MSEVFLGADWHFGHAKILEYESIARPFKDIETHDAQLIKNWNSRVTRRDVIWVLGDMFLSPKVAERVLPQLNGLIRLVLGNHDEQWFRGRYGKWVNYIHSVHAVVPFRRNIVFSHVPLRHIGERQRWHYNVHGHMHSKKIDDPNYFCVSVEHINLAPISFTELLEATQWGKQPLL